MRVAVLYTGGKDSTRCVEFCLRKRWATTLVTIKPKSPEAYLWHYPCVQWTLLSAHALGLPLVIVQCEGATRKAEASALEKALTMVNVDALVMGITRSLSQLKAIEKVAKKHKLKVIAPFKGKNHYRLLKQMIQRGYDIRITAVAAEGLGPEWLGKRLSMDALEELKRLSEVYSFDVGLEGGEAETFVCDGPIFKQKVKFIDVKKVWDAITSSGYLDVGSACLVSK
jgi:predicted ATP pyrophosphatase (TIGR00289 family)